MDVVGKYLLIKKHRSGKSKGKRRVWRRRFGDANEIELARLADLATQYAADNKEDFLIVQVVKEISKPIEIEA